MSDYALEGPKWNSSTVTWSFADAGGSISGAIGSEYRGTLEAAVARWAAVTNLRLVEVADSAAVDIRVGWGLFNDGQIGEADYTYRVGNERSFVAGTTVRLEDPSARPVGTSRDSRYQGTSTTLYQVMLHEFGHALGLDHSTDPHAIMFPTLGTDNVDLDGSDIAGVGALYGQAAAVMAALKSPAASMPDPVTSAPVTLTNGQLPVYRFFDKNTGAQFLTGDTGERDTLIRTRLDLVYEGLGLAGLDPDGDDPAAAPVFRFFDTRTGTHLFTTSTDEVATIARTRPDLVAEQASFCEHLTAQPGDKPVFRFFEKTDGTHFFTGSGDERANLIATRSDMVYEGIAFYAPSAA